MDPSRQWLRRYVLAREPYRSRQAQGARIRANRHYLNEYNVFQWSEHPLVKGTDSYANWYRRHADELLHAGAPLHGFGTPQADSFLIWAIWENAAVPPPASVLFDKQDRLTTVGERYDELMQRWTTDTVGTVGSSGSIGFDGFYGDYVVEGASVSGSFTLTRGTTEYEVALTPQASTARR